MTAGRLKIPSRIQSLYARFARPRSFLLFLFVGGLNTIIGIGMFPLLYWRFSGLGVNQLIFISYVLCTGIAFLTHRFITFQSNGTYRAEGTKFFILSTTLFLINISMMNLIMHFFATPPVPLQIGITLVLSCALMIANYLGMDRFVFKQGKA